MPACPRYLGPLGLGISERDTDGIGLVDNTRFVALLYDDDDYAQLAHYEIPASEQALLVPTAVYDTAGIHDDVFLSGQIAVRSTGEVYYYDFDPPGPSFDQYDLYRQLDGDYEILTTVTGAAQGLCWNPYDDHLYDFFRVGTNDWYVRIINPDTGAILRETGPFPGDGIESDAPVFTPDGAVWFYADLHPCRFDIANDTFEVFYDIDPRDISGSPVPAWGTPSAAQGDVFTELDLGLPDGTGHPILLHADGSYDDAFTCAPFWPSGGNETARVSSSDFGTLFIWPTIGAFGNRIWLIEGSRSAWHVGHFYHRG